MMWSKKNLKGNIQKDYTVSQSFNCVQKKAKNIETEISAHNNVKCFNTMSGIHSNKQEHRIHTEKKNQPIETDPELIQMLAYKD